MKHKRILLMFISEVSGHHQASLACEEALHRLDPEVETLNINAFNFTNPVLEKVINRAYMGVIKNMPGVWDYLYDNPKVVKRTEKLKDSIHRHNSRKLKTLLDDFRPDGIVCTQAFPCGMIADLKKHHNLPISLFGILTDYAPHSYWIYNNVDTYVVPSKEVGAKLVKNGVPEDRIKPFGIPVYSRFKEELDRTAILRKLGLKEGLPIILLMGGGQGLGPMRKEIWALDRITADLAVIAVTGSNHRLYNYVRKNQNRFKKKVIATQFAENIDELMSISTLIVTKPGGLTTAEALCKGLPMVIIDPLPGQEALNTDFLLSKGLAVKVNDETELRIVIKELLENPGKLGNMSSLAGKFAKPDAAAETARLILELN